MAPSQLAAPKPVMVCLRVSFTASEIDAAWIAVTVASASIVVKIFFIGKVFVIILIAVQRYEIIVERNINNVSRLFAFVSYIFFVPLQRLNHHR